MEFNSGEAIGRYMINFSYGPNRIEHKVGVSSAIILHESISICAPSLDPQY